MTRIFLKSITEQSLTSSQGIGYAKWYRFFRNEVINKNVWRGKYKVNCEFDFFFFVSYFLFILEFSFLGCHSRSQQWEKIWEHINRNVNEWTAGSNMTYLLESWHWNQDTYYWLLTFGSASTLALKIHILFISLIIRKREKDRFYISSGKIEDLLY